MGTKFKIMSVSDAGGDVVKPASSFVITYNRFFSSIYKFSNTINRLFHWL